MAVGAHCHQVAPLLLYPFDYLRHGVAISQFRIGIDPSRLKLRTNFFHSPTFFMPSLLYNGIWYYVKKNVLVTILKKRNLCPKSRNADKAFSNLVPPLSPPNPA